MTPPRRYNPDIDPPTRFPRRIYHKIDSLEGQIGVIQDNLDRLRDKYDQHGPHGAGGTGEEFPPFPTAIADLAATRSLIGYWRLGELAGVFHDTSGQADAADGTLVLGVGTPMTRHDTGGLPTGDDDGAITLNDDDGVGSDWINTNSGGDGSRFNLPNNMSIVALVNPTDTVNNFPGSIIGQVGVDGLGGLAGWMLQMSFPDHKITFFRREALGSISTSLVGPTLPAGEWVLIVATYSTVDGAKLYYNGTVVATDPTLVGPLPTNNADPEIGRGGTGAHPTANKAFYGGLDEISVWGDTLTQDDIDTLVGSFGRVGGDFITVIHTSVNYTMTQDDDVVLADATLTVTLPTAIANSGKSVTVKNTGVGTVTVDGLGAETIDGNLTETLGPGDSLTVVSDGSNWFSTTTSGTPSGPVGGVLSGTLPNPGFAQDMATQIELDAHVNDTTDAHDASAISVLDTAGYYASSDVEGALAELNPANAHLIWVPLFDSDGSLVLDDDGGLIPTLIPI